jgi:shikimate kinase
MNSVPKNIYLIGLMGAGKSTVGKMLAKRLGKTFYDSDHEIEKRCGVKIPTIFEMEGEGGFRRRNL